jgi:hypothetical protein
VILPTLVFHVLPFTLFRLMRPFAKNGLQNGFEILVLSLTKLFFGHHPLSRTIS